MRIDHRPAETIQVDWVGDTAEVVDPDTGELLRVYVFAGCLPYSNYLFAEGFYRTDSVMPRRPSSRATCSKSMAALSVALRLLFG